MFLPIIAGIVFFAIGALYTPPAVEPPQCVNVEVSGQVLCAPLAAAAGQIEKDVKLK
jgi:hypothetical protein